MAKFTISDIYGRVPVELGKGILKTDSVRFLGVARACLAGPGVCARSGLTGFHGVSNASRAFRKALQEVLA